MKVDSSKYGLLLIDNFNIDVKTRGKITSKIMTDVRPRKFCMMKAPMLSLFATGRTTGLVVDCGNSITSVCAVYEGYTLPHAIDYQMYGGKDATQLFYETIQDKFKSKLEDYGIIREIQKLKERACRVAYRSQDGREDDPSLKRKYKLPDKKLITLNSKSIFEPLEILFSGLKINNENKTEVKSLINMIQETLHKCDNDIVPILRNNVVVSGGNSMHEGFKERLRKEVEE